MPKKSIEPGGHGLEALSQPDSTPDPADLLMHLLKSNEDTRALLRERYADDRAGGPLLQAEAHLPRHKCKEKGTIVGEGNGAGTSWYWRTASRAAAIKEAQDAADADAKQQAKDDAGLQMTNLICQTGCLPKFDTANPVSAISARGTPAETPGTAGSTDVSCTASATYEIKWECV
jgi:hypothetical protein